MGMGLKCPYCSFPYAYPGRSNLNNGNDFSVGRQKMVQCIAANRKHVWSRSPHIFLATNIGNLWGCVFFSNYSKYIYIYIIIYIHNYIYIYYILYIILNIYLIYILYQTIMSTSKWVQCFRFKEGQISTCLSIHPLNKHIKRQMSTNISGVDKCATEHSMQEACEVWNSGEKISLM